MIYTQAKLFLNKEVTVVKDNAKLVGTLTQCEMNYGRVYTKSGEVVKVPLTQIYPKKS